MDEDDTASAGIATRLPLMFGYVRVELLCDHLDEVLEHLRKFASYENFDLAEVFIEVGPTTSALWQLGQALESTGARNVITPTPTHLDGGGNPQRRMLCGRIYGENVVWHLDQTEDTARYRASRRNRDIPASSAVPAQEPRRVFGPLELRAAASGADEVRSGIHELLAKANLPDLPELVAPIEQVVQAVLGEAAAGAAAREPAIYAELADHFPLLLSPPHNHLTVWLAQSRARDFLEVHVFESASRATLTMSPAVSAVADGRYALSTGGIATWARVPVVARVRVPAVLGPAGETAPGRAEPAPVQRSGTGDWGASTTYMSSAAAELTASGRGATPHAGQHRRIDPSTEGR